MPGHSWKPFTEINTIPRIEPNIAFFYFRNRPVSIPFYFIDPIVIVKRVFS